MAEKNPLGLSDQGLAVIAWCLETDATGHGGTIAVQTLQKQFGLDRTQTENVVGELESNGLLTIQTPASGATVEPTHRAVMALQGQLPFDPKDDVRVVAVALCESNAAMSGKDLQEKTNLDARRLNLASRCIEGDGLADVQHGLGQSDYCFTSMRATYDTRKFVGVA